MKLKIRKLVIILLLLLFEYSTSLAEEEILRPSLEPSFNMTEQGLCYTAYGESIISQDRLRHHSILDIKDIPKDASIIKAFLYWSGECEAYKAADTKVELKDPEGKTVIVDAEKIWTDLINGLVYVSKADVSKHISGNGKYEISYIDADPLEPVEIQGKIKKKAYYTLGGWALVVIFKDPGIKSKSNIQIYDGLLYLPSGEAKREGKYGLQRLGHDISKETLYPRASVKIEDPKLPKADIIDIAIISGFGRPWDGGSVVIDGLPIGGKENFASTSGFSWDISRDLIFIDKADRKEEHKIEFIPDYNSIMPIAVITKFGNLETDEVMRIAKSYIEQANSIDSLNFFDLRDSSFEEREFMAKHYIKEILHTKAISLFEDIKNLNLDKTYELHLALGKLYLEQNRFELAEMELKEAVDLKKDDYQAYFELSQVYYKKRDIDNTIFYLKKAKEVSKDNSLICLNLGTCLLQKGLFEDAIKEFEEAIKLDPKNLVPYYSLYNIYEAKGENSKKADILKKIEAIKGKNQE